MSAQSQLQDQAATDASPAARAQEFVPQRGNWFRENRTFLIPYLLIAILLAAAAIRAPGFVTASNLTQQLVLASYLGVIAGGQTIVILTGGIDLSVAWNLNLSAILLTQLSEQMPIFWAAAIALGSASFVGLLNGLGIAYLRIPSLVMTLGMNAVLAAAAPGEGRDWLVEVYSDGDPSLLEEAEPAVRLLIVEAVRQRTGLPTVRAAVA